MPDMREISYLVECGIQVAYEHCNISEEKCFKKYLRTLENIEERYAAIAVILCQCIHDDPALDRERMIALKTAVIVLISIGKHCVSVTDMTTSDTKTERID